MNQINKETKIFISISSRPSNLGTKIYNNIFKRLKINAIYKSFKVTNLEDLKKTILFLDLKGVSVSMPFKEKVINHLDKLDEVSKKIKIVNTIKNQNGKLIGYNTDFLAIKKKFLGIKKIRGYNFLLYGNGAIAKTVIFALKSLMVRNIYVTGRNKKKINNLKKKLGFKIFDKKKSYDYKKLFLINCSLIGMVSNKHNKTPFESKLISRSSVVMDLVNYPSETKLIKLAKKFKKKIITGSSISLHQIKYQSEIYLKKKIKINLIKNSFKNK